MIRSAVVRPIGGRARTAPRLATGCVRTIVGHPSKMRRPQSAKADFVLPQARVSNPGSHGGAAHHADSSAIAISHLTGARAAGGHTSGGHTFGGGARHSRGRGASRLD